MEEIVKGPEDLAEINLEHLELADWGKINGKELDLGCFEFVDCMKADYIDIQEPIFDPLSDVQVKLDDEKDFEDGPQQQFMLVDLGGFDATVAVDALSAKVLYLQSQNTNTMNDEGNENRKAVEATWYEKKRENKAQFRNDRPPLSDLENNYHCAASFDDTTQNSIQNQTDENDKIYKCSQCSYASKSKGNLSSHMLKHTNEKKYKCTICNFRTAYNQCFKTHTAMHRGEKKYSCTECSFKTAYGNFLKTHLARHRGEKNFSCPECCYKTLYKQCLKNHIAIVHRHEKVFDCKKCSFRTAYRYHLKIHLLQHMQERKGSTYYCANCSYNTPFHQSMAAHLRQVCQIPNEET